MFKPFKKKCKRPTNGRKVRKKVEKSIKTTLGFPKIKREGKKGYGLPRVVRERK